MEREGHQFEGLPDEGKEKFKVPEVDRDAIRLKLAKKLKNFLDDEQRFGRMPKMEFDFYFAKHVLGTDLERMDDFFQEADIFIPESVGVTPGYETTLNKIALGEVGRNKVVDEKSDTFNGELLKKIYNSKKVIAVVDAPEGHHSIKLIQSLGNYQVRGPKLAKATEAGATFHEQARIGTAEMGKLQSMREEYILLNLGKKLKEIFKTHPDLRKKDQVRVLFSLGAMHVTLYHALKDVGLETKREFSMQPYIYNYRQEAARKTFLTKTHDLDDELIEKMGLEQVVFSQLAKPGYWRGWQSSKGSVVGRILIDQLSADEIGEILRRESQFSNFIDKLQSKGITLPASEAEANALIKKHAPGLKIV